jgi:SOS-response transcriptional repressor LexA
MHLKALIHRELGEGLAEEELASMVGVSMRTITSVLADKLPRDPATWRKFAKYFRMDADFLRTGGAPSKKVFGLSESLPRSAAGDIRRVPLINWDQIEEAVTNKDPHRVLRAVAMIETTDVPGMCTFALKVRDNAMQPLFSIGEMIFVNPDATSRSGDYVVAESPDGSPGAALLREIKKIGKQYILHPLNRRYEALPLGRQRVWGKVVRLRKNL